MKDYFTRKIVNINVFKTKMCLNLKLNTIHPKDTEKTWLLGVLLGLFC